MIDLHAHILPGLDDGAQTMKEAMEIARAARQNGIKKIVATPHLFRNNFIYEDLNIIETKKTELIKNLRVNDIDLKIFRGAEVHISHNLIDEIKKNKKHLVINNSSYMFVEFPSEHVFSRVKSLFFDLMSEGIRPIIAHPERNYVFINNPEILYELVQMGALAQANSGSFSGLYGRSSMEAVFNFIELGLIHFIASDCHNTYSIPPQLSEAVAKTSEMIGEKKARAMVEDNPQAVLDNREIAFLPEALNPKAKQKSFSLKIPHVLRRNKN